MHALLNIISMLAKIASDQLLIVFIAILTALLFLSVIIQGIIVIRENKQAKKDLKFSYIPLYNDTYNIGDCARHIEWSECISIFFKLDPKDFTFSEVVHGVTLDYMPQVELDEDAWLDSFDEEHSS